MAAIKFKLAVLTTGGFAAPMLTSEQLRSYRSRHGRRAEKPLGSRAEHLGRGGEAATRMWAAKGKVRFGQPMVRNMKMTSLMTNNFSVAAGRQFS